MRRYRLHVCSNRDWWQRLDWLASIGSWTQLAAVYVLQLCRCDLTIALLWLKPCFCSAPVACAAFVCCQVFCHLIWFTARELCVRRVTAAMILVWAGPNKLKLYCKLMSRSLQIKFFYNSFFFASYLCYNYVWVSWSLFQKIWHGTFFQLWLNTVLLLSTLLGWPSMCTSDHHIASVRQHNHPKIRWHNLEPYMCTLAWAGRILHFNEHATCVACAFSPNFIVTHVVQKCFNVLRHQALNLKFKDDGHMFGTADHGAVVQHIQVFASAITLTVAIGRQHLWLLLQDD